jgi:hypothetical protein
VPRVREFSFLTIFIIIISYQPEMAIIIIITEQKARQKKHWDKSSLSRGRMAA